MIGVPEVADHEATWSHPDPDGPQRLRACAKDECAQLLLDHSKAGTARWCSMATCRDRLKARRHQERCGGCVGTYVAVNLNCGPTGQPQG